MTDLPTPDLPAVRELPAMDRLRVRILVGSLKMIEGQLSGLPPAVLDEADLPGPYLATVWRERAERFYAATTDAPGPKPARASTTGPDVGETAWAPDEEEIGAAHEPVQVALRTSSLPETTLNLPVPEGVKRCAAEIEVRT